MPPRVLGAKVVAHSLYRLALMVGPAQRESDAAHRALGARIGHPTRRTSENALCGNDVTSSASIPQDAGSREWARSSTATSGPITG